MRKRKQGKKGGDDLPMDEYFSRTYKFQKGENVGNWVSQQSQDRFESSSRLKEEIASNSTRQSQCSSQDETTQPKMPLDLCIYSQSGERKKKGRIAGIGSLGKAMDSILSLPSSQFPSSLLDNPMIASMKDDLKALRRENEQLKQRQEIMNKQLQQILQHLPNLNNFLGDSSTQSPHGDKNSKDP